MREKIWKKKVTKKIIEAENGEISFEKIEWKRDKNAERWARYNKKKAKRKYAASKFSLIEKPISSGKPKVIRRKKADIMPNCSIS